MARLSRNLPDALWRFDNNLVRTIVDSELGTGDVLGIEVFDEQGQSAYLASNRVSGQPWNPAKTPADVERSVRLSYEESQARHPLGVVRIYATTQAIRDNVRRDLVRLVGVMLALNVLVALVLLVSSGARGEITCNCTWGYWRRKPLMWFLFPVMFLIMQTHRMQI